jgi:hypothetical protein
MMYKAKVAVCSEIRTKHSMQGEHRVEFLIRWYVKKPLGFQKLKCFELLRSVVCRTELQHFYLQGQAVIVAEGTTHLRVVGKYLSVATT